MGRRRIDRRLFEEQVIRYVLETYPLITIDLLVRVVHRIKPHRKKGMVSLAAQEWIRQGKAEGMAEGEARGKITSILLTLEFRFGKVAADIEARVRQTAPEMLDDMQRRACTTQSLGALFAVESRH